MMGPAVVSLRAAVHRTGIERAPTIPHLRARSAGIGVNCDWHSCVPAVGPLLPVVRIHDILSDGEPGAIGDRALQRELRQRAGGQHANAVGQRFERGLVQHLCVAARRQRHRIYGARREPAVYSLTRTESFGTSSLHSAGRGQRQRPVLGERFDDVRRLQ